MNCTAHKRRAGLGHLWKVGIGRSLAGPGYVNREHFSWLLLEKRNDRAIFSSRSITFLLFEFSMNFP